MTKKERLEVLLREIPTLLAAAVVWLLPNVPQLLVKSVLTAAIVVIRVLFEILSRRAPRVWRALSLLRTPTDASTTKPLHVVVVHDASTVELAEAIRASHDVDEIQPTTALLAVSDAGSVIDDATSKSLLPRKVMDGADAIYVVWSETLERQHELARKELEDWAWQHMKTPVLIVNPGELAMDHLPFTVIPVAKATPPRISMQLMARTRAWVDLAIRLNRRWIYMSGLSLTFLIAFVYFGIHYWRLINYLDTGMESDETTMATTLVAWRNQHATIQTGALTAPLDAIMKYALDDIARATDVRSTESDSISIFRRDGDAMLWVNSLAGRPQTFGLNSSIVGCAASLSAFVLWETKCRPGTEAAWDKSGDVIGRCKADGMIAIDGHPDCKYDPNLPEMNNKAMLCYSPDIVGGDQSTRAVCIVTSKETEKAFLRNPITRAKLRMLAIAIDSLPDSALPAPNVKPVVQPGS